MKREETQKRQWLIAMYGAVGVCQQRWRVTTVRLFRLKTVHLADARGR